MSRKTTTRIWRAALAAAVLMALGLFAAGVPAAAASGRSVLIVAPHPDDDLLYGAGIAAAALSHGDSVKVVYMTNGDAYDGVPDGYTREDEAVHGQQIIGNPESNLIFLGYPDGGLLALLDDYPDSADTYTSAHGQSETYGDRGLGSCDYHFFKLDTHAAYNGANVLQDLHSILVTYRPDDIYTTGVADTHTDHEATYWFVRAALLARMAADPTYRPTLYKTIVHCDGGSRWPAAVDPQTLMSQPPGYTEPGYEWSAHKSVVVPQAMQATDLAANPKYQAINAHQSQGGAAGHDGFLGSFVHKDEVFWIDSLDGAPPVNHAPTADAGAPQTADASSLATLDGSGSSDPDGDALEYEWTQIEGLTVSLSSHTAKRPTFTVPAGTDSLTFKLVVSDGALSSDPATVTVTVNHAPSADAGAPQAVNAGSLAILDGSGSSDPDGDDLEYEWTQTSGLTVTLSSPTAQRPTFSVPVGAVSLTFELIVDDGRLSSGAASVTVLVNHAPTANAGASQKVAQGSLVTLDGSGSSDPDEDSVSYAWTQSDGPAVSLSSATSRQPTFTAPAGATSLTFRLVVSDGQIQSGAASVTITVQATPLTIAGGLQSSADSGWINRSQTIVLSASGGASGVTTYYKVDDGSRQSYGGPFPVSAPGSHKVTFWSVDDVGNQEDTQTGFVNIDLTVPAIGSDADSKWHKGAVTVHLTPVDGGGSGVAATQYRVKGSATWLPAVGDAFTVSGAGARVYEFRALDRAGNASGLGSCTVRIDRARPRTATPYSATVRRFAKVTLKFKVLDAQPTSGRATVTLKIRTLKGKSVKTLVLKNRKVNSLQSYRFRCTLKKGSYRLYVYATDRAGNVQRKVAHNTLRVR